MKKLSLFLMAIVMSALSMPAFAQSGTLGSSTNPFLISSFAELKTFRDSINSGKAFKYWANTNYTVNKGGQGQYFKIANSAPSGMGNDGGLVASTTEWVPIGNSASPFYGKFDGNYKVVGYRVTSSNTATDVGLFGYISTDAVVKNLTVIPYIASPSGVTNCGGVVGRAASTSEIDNCVVTTAARAGFSGSKVPTIKIDVSCNNVGGIVGVATNGATVKNCVNYLSIPGNTNVGGIVGQLYGQGTNICKVSNCTNYGNVTASTNVGGIVGYMPYANMFDCANYATIRGAVSVGGVAGWINRNSTVQGCVNCGTIRGEVSVGGLVGRSTDGEDGYSDANAPYMQSAIRNGVNTGNVYGFCFSSTDKFGIGGILGTSQKTKNSSSSSMSRRGTWVETCINYGAIETDFLCTGGIVGYMASGSLDGVLSSAGFGEVGARIGGIVGNTDGGTITFDGCLYDAAFHGARGIGGIDYLTDPMGVNVISDGNIYSNALASYWSKYYFSYLTNMAPVPSGLKDSDIRDAARVVIVHPCKFDMEFAEFTIYAPNTVSLSTMNSTVTWTTEDKTDYTCYKATPVATGQDTLMVKDADGLLLRKIPFYLKAPRPGREIPIQISTLAQLKALRDGVNSGQAFSWTSPAVTVPAGAAGFKFELTADIDILSESVAQSSGLMGWTPIGNSYSTPFSGTFDGKGHMIINMQQIGSSITAPVEGLGLFGVLRDAHISNLNVHAAEGVMGHDVLDYITYSGAIAGYASLGTTFTNCAAYGTVVGGTSVGGIVGCTSGDVELKDCRNATIIKGQTRIGGIVGYMEGTTTSKPLVSHCVNIGTIQMVGEISDQLDSRPYGGGLVGLAEHAVIKNVMNAGLVEAGATSVSQYGHHNGPSCGGVVGFASDITIDSALVLNRVRALVKDATTNMLVGSFSPGCNFFNCFADESFVFGDGHINTSRTENYTTSDMVGNGMKSLLPTWHFNVGRFPTPCTTESLIDSIASLPIYLAAGDHPSSVQHDFKLTPMNGLTWTSSNSNVLKVSGDTALLKSSSDSVLLRVATTVPGTWYSNSIEKRYCFKVVRPYVVVNFVNYDGTVLKSDTINKGESATAPTVPTRTGYTFSGWDKAFTNVQSDLTVTAEYSVITYTVTFTGFEGVILKTETVEYGKSATAPEVPTIEGYTFVGWTGDFSVVLSNRTIAARYAVNTYTVTFVDYDDRVIETQTITHGYDATDPAQPTRTGYTFNGWDKDFDNVTSDLTVKAQYTINTYTVTFVDYDDAVLKIETVDYGQDATAPADPVREGYTFTGWDNDFSYVTSTVVVTAQYTINTFTVTFVDYDGAVLKYDVVEYGSSAVAPISPVREGYLFIGWDTDFSVVTTDLTVTAMYEPVAEGLSNMVLEHQADKRMINGQLYILKNGCYYDATGRVVRL